MSACALASEADDLMTEAQLCARLHVTRRTTLRWRNSGDGPRYIRVGEARILYRTTEVEAWLQRRTFAHRAAEAVGLSAA